MFIVTIVYVIFAMYAITQIKLVIRTAKKGNTLTDKELVIGILKDFPYPYEIKDNLVEFKVDSPGFDNKLKLPFNCILSENTRSGMIKFIRGHQCS